jgi:ribonuclease R
MAESEMPTEKAVLQALRGSSRGPLKPKELARALDVPNEAYKDFRRLLGQLESLGRVYRVKGGRYAVPEKINLLVGRLSTIKSGDGFVLPEDGAQDVFVRAQDFNSAMDGDQVVVRIEGRPRGRNPFGSVIKVLERSTPTLVGTYHLSRRFGYVVPRNRKVVRDVLIPQGEDGGAADRDVVVVRITSYGDSKLPMVGTVERVLGPIDDPGVDVLSVLYGHGLPLEFPPEVEAAAEMAARSEKPVAGQGRRDCRDLHVFTIDPADAKDHDDALSVEPAGEGLWEVGIHIADVGHYVEEGGTVDVEALSRGTSVYLVDRVVPMLPHALSSDVCSLRPDGDRLAVSLFAVLDREGRVRSHRFERTLIRSRHRLSYEQVQDVLDGVTPIDPTTDEALHRLDELARVLRRIRLERGSIDFDLPEARVILGSEGDPIDIQRVLRLESHRLIEDFMLLANEIVASEASRRSLPVLFRVHEPPTSQKAESLGEFLTGFGLHLPKRKLHPKDLQKLLARVEGKPESNLISTVVLRSMQRARYSKENLGHFGLAADNYCHFTSPIRRYPDLVTHRVVVRAFVEGLPVPESWSRDLEAVAERSSEREQLAAAAERDSVELKKIEFMERHLGEEFDGTISGVTSFGFFVLLDDFFVEGLVHVNALQDDYYEFHDDDYVLVGTRRGRRFRLGDRVRVEVARLDKEERHVDFMLVRALPRG